jgi:hypothetical protein
MLVAAVLGPQHREDGELEVVRRPIEQLLDTGELPVRQTERSMEGLLRDRGQDGQCSRGVRCGFGVLARSWLGCVSVVARPPTSGWR